MLREYISLADNQVMGDLETMVHNDIKNFHEKKGDEPVAVESYAEYVDKYWEEVIKAFAVSPRIMR